MRTQAYFFSSIINRRLVLHGIRDLGKVIFTETSINLTDFINDGVEPTPENMEIANDNFKKRRRKILYYSIYCLCSGILSMC